MLVQLDIRNVALIDRVNIEPGDGLNVLTGETGAGKSIIIDSINAILGERISKDIIRTGRDKALVEAVFQADSAVLSDIYDEMGIEPEEDGTLILSREIAQSGKNTCRINGKMATVTMLKRFGERLIDMHGQYDNQSLLRTESHIYLLDSFGGESLKAVKARYQKLLAEYRSINARLRELSGNPGERERRIDLFKFKKEEIRKAKLQKDEEEELNRQRTLLANSEKIVNSFSQAYELLFSDGNSGNSASDSLNEALSELNTVAGLAPEYADVAKKLQDVVYQLEDIIEDVRSQRDETEFNPGLLEEIDGRLDMIFRLKRKYGGSIDEILDYCSKAELQLDEMIQSSEIAEQLHTRLMETDMELLKAAAELNGLRREAAALLEERIGSELSDLEMKRARFKVDIAFNDAMDAKGIRGYREDGLDRVEFLISANAGEPLKSLSKIASGGEMSRIMLAIKTILADVDMIPTLIFDEIDIGISGKAAQKVGEKLSYISGNHQVVCVTHLAQIASMADQHFLIEKTSKEDNTETSVTKLAGSGIRDEIARIVAGSDRSETSERFADELLCHARNLKSQYKTPTK